MRTLSTTTLAATLLLAAASAQRESLLFTTLERELTQSNVPPMSLQHVYPEDVMTVTPMTALPSAQKFAPHDAWLTLTGDEDGDGRYWESALAGKVDAICVRRATAAYGPSPRDLYFSPAIQIDGCVSATGPLRPGDMARVERDGQFVFFVREEQIKLAFGMPATERVNIDAFALDRANRRVCFSLEDDHRVTIMNAAGLYTTTVEDGSILAIPYAVEAEPIQGVLPNSGLIVARESEVDAMVINSLVRDVNGLQALQILDLDGLELDPKGGWFTTQTGRWPNLLFCGETLTLGGILSTAFQNAGFGSIALVNGVPMASAVQTTGWQVGLRQHGGASRSLNGLAIDDPICAYVTETLFPVVSGGKGNVSVDVGGADPGVAFLLMGGAPPGPCDVTKLTPLWNPCFPELIPFVHIFALPINGQGFGTWQVPAVWGNQTIQLVFQSVSIAVGGGFRLSTPLTIELLP